MNFENEPMSNELRIQLLVDSQLDHHQRSDWLKSIGPDDELWRTIALRFVENQILDEALVPGSKMVENEAVTSRGISSSNSSRSSSQLGWWVAIAASLLMGLGVGWLFKQQEEKRPTVVATPVPLAAPDESKESKELHLPLADALARSVTPVSYDTRRAFLKAGYFVDESSEMASVELPTGNSVRMPVRQFTIRYLGQSAFQ